MVRGGLDLEVGPASTEDGVWGEAALLLLLLLLLVLLVMVAPSGVVGSSPCCCCWPEGKCPGCSLLLATLLVVPC